MKFCHVNNIGNITSKDLQNTIYKYLLQPLPLQIWYP